MIKKLKALHTDLKLYLKIRKEEFAKNSEGRKDLAQTKYRTYYKSAPIIKNTILYESYAGRGMVCNPYAIFKYLLHHPEFTHLKHYWIIEDFEDNRWIMEQYKNYSNIYFIKYRSDSYYKYMASCEYLITNVAFPAFLTPKSGQHYINTWHGIPLKTLGFDIPKGNISSRNTLRNFLMCDYLISPNSFMTSIYKTAFRLDGLYPGSIVEEGQPRNDLLFHTNSDDIKRKLLLCGIKLDLNKKIILYAPTWRGEIYEEPDTDLNEYFRFLKILEDTIDTTKYQILIKPHQIVYKYIKSNKALTDQFIPATIDANELMSIVDVLISDFSSIFFDFLATNRPVLFYIPDLEEYKKSRGLYNSIDFLPGPVTDTMEDLPYLIANLENVQKDYKKQYINLKSWACPYDNGAVCERLINTIFYHKNEYRQIKCQLSQKKKLLIYGGNLCNRSIRTSILGLINCINFDQFDVTLFLLPNNDQSNYDLICSIDSKVRVLSFLGPYNSDLKEQICYRMSSHKDSSFLAQKLFFPNKLFSDESKRIVGNASFDFVFDFAGDNFYYQSILHKIKSNIFIDRKEIPQFIDLSKMKQNLDEDYYLYTDNKEYYISSFSKNNAQEKDFKLFLLPPEQKWIATMGDLSKKEPYENVINAFAKYLVEYPDRHLFILGSGAAQKSLYEKVKKLGLVSYVTFTGFLENPFPLLKRCDCFIYPLPASIFSAVLLEAKGLHLPVVEAESVDDIYNSLLHFEINGLSNENLDLEEYNRHSYKHFLSLLK